MPPLPVLRLVEQHLVLPEVIEHLTVHPFRIAEHIEAAGDGLDGRRSDDDISRKVYVAAKNRRNSLLQGGYLFKRRKAGIQRHEKKSSGIVILAPAVVEVAIHLYDQLID